MKNLCIFLGRLHFRAFCFSIQFESHALLMRQRKNQKKSISRRFISRTKDFLPFLKDEAHAIQFSIVLFMRNKNIKGFIWCLYEKLPFHLWYDVMVRFCPRNQFFLLERILSPLVHITTKERVIESK